MSAGVTIRKNDSIDYLKAFAITMVVIHHVIMYADLIPDFPVMYTVIEVIQSVHVPLFFSIAGYLCHKQPLSTYYIKKIKRIYIPFLTFTILKLIYTTFISAEFAHASTTSERIIDAFFYGSLYWFIYPMLIFFLFAPLLWQFKKLNIVIFVFLLVANTYIGFPTFNFLQIGQAFYNACFFVAGFLLQQYQTQISAFEKKCRLALVLVSITLTLYLSYSLYMCTIYYSFQIRIILAFTQMYLLWIIAKKLPENISVLKTMGKYSLQIMLFDSFFKVILFLLVRQFASINIVTAFLTVPMNILLGCITCMVVQRIPIIRKLIGL